MKAKIMNTLILVLLGAASVATAQKIADTKVPAAVKSAFSKAHPGITKVKWDEEKGSYEAGFLNKGVKTSESYSADGKMTESEVAIKASELPAGVADYVKKHYKGAAVKETAKITKSNGEVNYETEVKGSDLIFDSKGTFIKAVKD